MQIHFDLKRKQLTSGCSQCYTRYRSARTLIEALELSATTVVINLDFLRGYIQFPKNESQLPGHVFNARILANETGFPTHSETHRIYCKLSNGARRPSKPDTAFNKALKVVDEELTNVEFDKLLEDKVLMMQHDICAERMMPFNAKIHGKNASFVDWHIAAEPSHYNDILKENCFEHPQWESAMFMNTYC